MSNLINKYKISLIFFFFILFLNYSKTPYIFQNGRFIENDAIHYANALNSSWSEVVFLIYWAAGYLNFFANINSFLNSRFISLEYASLFNIYFSFIIVVLIHIFILFTKSDFLKNFKEKFLASILITISPIFVFEIWLDSMNAQIYLCLLAFFILFTQHNLFTKICSPIILIISGLSGVYSCLLAPLFYYKYYKSRSIINKLNFLILLISSITQFSIIIFSKLSNNLSPGKLNLNFFLNYNEIESFVYNIIIRPFLSTTFSNYIIDIFKIENKVSLKLIIIIFILSLISIFLIFFVKMIIKKKNILNFEIISLTYLFFSCSFLITIGGVNDFIGGRYSVIPAFCLIFLLFKILFNKNVYFFFRKVSFLLILLSLLSGIYDYRLEKWIIFYECIECPEWKDEIKKYNLNNDYKIKVWPYDVQNEVDLSIKYF